MQGFSKIYYVLFILLEPNNHYYKTWMLQGPSSAYLSSAIFSRDTKALSSCSSLTSALDWPWYTSTLPWCQGLRSPAHCQSQSQRVSPQGTAGMLCFPHRETSLGYWEIKVIALFKTTFGTTMITKLLHASEIYQELGVSGARCWVLETQGTYNSDVTSS
jgi:hypothetical protein